MFLIQSEENWQRDIDAEDEQGLTILRRLVDTVVQQQESIAQQEYVVTNGRIEAALSDKAALPSCGSLTRWVWRWPR